VFACELGGGRSRVLVHPSKKGRPPIDRRPEVGGKHKKADGGSPPSAFVSQDRNPVGRILPRSGLYMIAQAFRPGNRFTTQKLRPEGGGVNNRARK